MFFRAKCSRYNNFEMGLLDLIQGLYLGLSIIPYGARTADLVGNFVRNREAIIVNGLKEANLKAQSTDKGSNSTKILM